MYLTRAEFMVGANGTGAWEEFQRNIGEYRKGKPGVLGVTLLRSDAYPGKYVLVSRWESPEASWELQKSKGYLDVLKGATNLNVSPGRPQEGYTDVFNVDAEGLSPASASEFTCEVLADWQLDRGQSAPEFEKNRKDFFEMQKKNMKGFGSTRLRRSAGDPSKYLGIGLCKDRESFMDPGYSAAVRKEMAELSPRNFLASPTQIEVFAVIHRI